MHKILKNKVKNYHQRHSPSNLKQLKSTNRPITHTTATTNNVTPTTLLYNVFDNYLTAYFLVPMKKKEGVKILSRPPSTRSMAVLLSREEILVEPAGAMNTSSSNHTMECVNMRPT